MCRLYGFRATHPTRVECTLVRAQNALLAQSHLDRSGVSHPDGWGIVAYDGGMPFIERRTSAAYDDFRFSAVAASLEATAVLAHVRRATIGSMALENTHPFVHGRWAFVHNGTVASFDVVGAQLASETNPALLGQRQGETDSELLFLWLLTRMKRAGIDLDSRFDGASSLARVVADSILLVASRCAAADSGNAPGLNVLLTNGQLLVGVRWRRPLFWLDRRGAGMCEVCSCGHVRQGAEERGYRAVVLASEPISGEKWLEAPDPSILTVDSALRVTLDTL